MARYALAVLGLTVPLCFAGCGSEPKQTETAAAVAQTPSPSQPAKYDMRGKVVAVDKAGKQITVNHDAITGFMGAMTMPYPVKDEKLLENLTPGQAITAKVVSTGSQFWLEDIAPAQQ